MCAYAVFLDDRWMLTWIYLVSVILMGGSMDKKEQGVLTNC